MSLVLILAAVVAVVNGHGYMLDPVGRNAMWHYGFPDAPTNYNMNENFCGGVGVQYGRNKGKCGICGDAYDAKPRPHEVGGDMYDGRIVKTYKAGQVIDMKVMITTNHQGFFQFKLCKSDPQPKQDVTQECLDKTVLDVVGRQDKKHHITYDDGKGSFPVKVQLPASFKCERCVLQWVYHVGNTWGCDKAGCGLGHGDQEEFINCSDIKIE